MASARADRASPGVRGSRRPLRVALDLLYDGCGILAALGLILIGVFVLAQVLGRLVGVPLPGTDDLAGYAMAGSTFLGLAHTLNRGAHVRVTLLADALAPRRARHLDLLAVVLAIACVGFLFYWMVDLAVESARFGEVATGPLKIPTVIPQVFMCLGVFALLLALIDAGWALLRGDRPAYASDGDAAEAVARGGLES